MVFSSIPHLYLQDPPTWQQQLGGGIENYRLPQPPPSLMINDHRAKLAKLTQPQMALKCPRCDSSNTKFCYYNNYSLSQPRHFCKTCRRYWTRGGALRNVPIGGGCRRNRRTNKGYRRSKSPVTAEHQTVRHCNSNYTTMTTSTTPVSSNSCTTDLIPLFASHEPNQLPFMPSSHHLNNDFGAGDTGFGNVSTGADIELLPVSRLSEPWRMQQFNQLSLAEPQSEGFQVGLPCDFGGAGGMRFEGLNLSRNSFGMEGNHDEYWGGNNNFNTWTTGLNCFTPAAASTHL